MWTVLIQEKPLLWKTMKKPVKQVAVKKETQDEANLSSLLSATSMVRMKLIQG